MKNMYRDKDWLYTKYFIENRSCLSLCKEYGFHQADVSRYFKKFGFKARPNGREMVGKPSFNRGSGLSKDGKYLSRYIRENGVLKKVREHRRVMSEFLGRPLKDTEVIHHINGVTTDNRIENLKLFSSAGRHTLLGHNHKYCGTPLPQGIWGRTLTENGYELLNSCKRCGTNKTPHYGKGFCDNCYYPAFREKIMKRSHDNYHKKRANRLS